MLRLLALALVVAVAAGCAAESPTTASHAPAATLATQTAADPGATTAPAEPAAFGTPEPTTAPQPTPTPDPAGCACLGCRRVPAGDDGTQQGEQQAVEVQGLQGQVLVEPHPQAMEGLYRKDADNERTWADQVRGITFPAELEADVRALLRASAKEEAFSRSAAGSRSWSELYRYDADGQRGRQHSSSIECRPGRSRASVSRVGRCAPRAAPPVAQPPSRLPVRSGPPASPRRGVSGATDPNSAEPGRCRAGSPGT